MGGWIIKKALKILFVDIPSFLVVLRRKPFSFYPHKKKRNQAWNKDLNHSRFPNNVIVGKEQEVVQRKLIEKGEWMI